LIIAKFQSKAEDAFAKMESNVDAFLDWYYQLSAEYLRVTKLLSGDIENYLAEKLAENLGDGKPFKDFDIAVTKAFAQRDSASMEHQETIRRILERNQAEVPDGTHVRVVQKLSLVDLGSLPPAPELVKLETRLGVGGAAGVVTSLVVQKIVGKVAGKGIFKLAVASAGKLLTGKAVGAAGGAASGAAAGAAIGSVIPGIGTVVGAAVGGVVGGILVGLAVDKGLLMLEEAVNRENFKQEIISVIRETKEEFMASLHP
jgi:hypothetical protein